MTEKTRLTSGADERTPSHPQYFAYINNNNEGPTEEQTFINLDYFKWLHDEYGMNLEIYAWDCGALDGAKDRFSKDPDFEKKCYWHPDETPRLKERFPNGYGPSAMKAAEFGCNLGVWAGPDGFGDTPEEEKKRYDLFVKLCRDYNFRLFKFDAVCSNLRPEKREIFRKMIDKCREYVPDLVVLNHRIDLGEAEQCATTFLWEGGETYIDVANKNTTSASHHRVGAMSRGLVPGLKRLTEDHGVCISSYVDFFEDDLILQAFGRCLILAPEIYGNPWLMRDLEQERLARIYNIHWKYRDILVDGMTLPESYGDHAVARGDGKTRFIVLKNLSWTQKSVNISISEEIGLSGCGEYIVKTVHPYESYVGTFKTGDTAEVTVEPFRAALIMVQEKSVFNETEFVLTNCAYETVTDGSRLPKRINVYYGNGETVEVLGNRALAEFVIKKPFSTTADTRLKAPVFLGEASDIALPENAEQLYETGCFAADCDCLEIKSLRRSGETAIPQVKAARDAFFNAPEYKARGTESSKLFDGNPNTYYDGVSVFFQEYYGGPRLSGGCLRVDFGKVRSVSRVEIEFFEVNEPVREVLKPHISEEGTFSSELLNWKKAPLKSAAVTEENVKAPAVTLFVETLYEVDGVKKTAVYEIGGEMRYFRLDQPMDKIYAIRFYDENGAEIKPDSPHANNMLAPFTAKKFIRGQKATLRVPENAPAGSYLAVGIDGEHGQEGAYSAVVCDGVFMGFEDRAVSFPNNFSSHLTMNSTSGYTYYMPVTDAIRGKEIDVYVLLESDNEITSKIWLCDNSRNNPAAVIEK